MNQETEKLSSEELESLIQEFKDMYGEEPEIDRRSYREKSKGNEPKIYAERTRKKKNIAKSALVLMCGSLLATALAQGAKLHKGAVIISKKYNDAIFHDVGYFLGSNGYIFNVGTDYVEYDDMINILKNRCEKACIPPVEAYIVLKSELSNIVAKDVLGEKPSIKEIVDTEIQAAEGKLYVEEEVVSRGK